MVAIVSGGTPGLNLGSREVLGQHGVTGNALQGRRGEGVYVNVATGAVVIESTDEQLVARGPDAAVLRTYNSTGSFNDDNGDQWSSGVVSLRVVGTVNAAGSAVLRVDRDGSTGTYLFDAARTLYVSADGAGAYDTITYVAAAAQFEWRDGSTGASQRFEGGGACRLLSSQDAGGNALAYGYGANGFLASVVTPTGEGTLYEYVGNNLAEVRTVANGVSTTRVRYAYDAAHRLSVVNVDLTPDDSSMADMRVYQTVFTYDGDSKRIASIGQTDGTRLAFTYVNTGGAFKVASITDALGKTTSFAYGAGFATVTDALGLVTRYEYDAAGQLTAITAPAAGGPAATKRFAYDTDGNVVSVTDGEGRVTSFVYDGAGNQRVQRDALGNTTVRLFDERNQLLTETVYTQADADGAGPALPAGPLTSRFVYDAGGRNQLRFTVSATGNVTEYRYDGFGQRIAQISYEGGAYPVGLWGPEASPGEAQLVAWVATQDRSATRRTDLAYDTRGQLQARTTYARMNAAGEGIADGSETMEYYVRDRAGLLLQTVSPATGVTTFTYDGLGRELTRTDALGQVTLTQYDDPNRRTTVTLAHGLVRTSAYDAANRLVAVADSSTAGAALGETKYFYDAGDRLRMTQDPTGVRSWTLYDEAGRKVADVDGNGTLTEYRHDGSDRLVHTMRWGTAVDTAALVDPSGLPVTTVTLAALRPAASAADQGTWRAYDQAGRLVRQAEQTGALGRAAVTEMRYDGASRLVEVVRFATTVAADGSTGELAPGMVPVPPASADDRVTRNFHDADGRLAGTLDAEGYLTVFKYDAAGQLTERLAYARATNTWSRASGTLAELVPLASDADIREVTLYDAQGRAIGHLDGEGYLTETVYDARGNVTQTVRYANRVAAAVTVSTQLWQIRAAPTSADRVTLRSYDALGRLLQETSPEGIVTRYAYDTAGRLVSTQRAADSEEVRTLLARYDLQGRLTGELSAAGAALLTGGQTQEEIGSIWYSYGTFHSYDAASRRTSTTGPLGQRSWFFYDADGALTHTVNNLGEVRETRYDTRGRVSETIAYANRIATAGLEGGLVTPALANALLAASNPALDTRVTIVSTRDGKVASETDALGNVRTFSYNAFGDETGLQWTGTGVNEVDTYAVDRRGLRRETIRDAAGLRAVTSTVHDAFGRAIRTVDAIGKVREQAFDRLGRVVSTRDPLNALRSTSYDAFDRTLRQTDALGNATSYAYSPGTRTMTVTTPEGIVSTTTYTRHGQVQSIADGKGQVTQYAYDRDGNLVKTTTPLTTASSSWDAAGRLVQTIDANGNAVSYSYDAANRVLTRRVDPWGLDLVTSYAYDGKGQRVAVTDANGVVTGIEYDRKGQVLKRTVDPAGLRLQTAYAYDARGNTLTVTTPGGSVTQYVYDALGRRVQERVDPAGLNLQRSWSYDGEGNVISSTDASGNLTRYVYDAGGRLLFTVGPLGHVQQNSYDLAGRLVRTRTYVAPVATSGLGPAPTAEQLLPLLVPVDAQDAIEHRVYDKDGRVAATVDGTGAVVKYSYDGAGNVVSRTAYANRVVGYAGGTMPAPVADAAHDDSVFTVYDAIDRPVYTVNVAGAVVAMAYDGNGNLLRRTAYATLVAPGTPITKDALAAAVAAVANPARDATIRNTWDAAGRLTWTVDGTGAVTQRVHDGNGNVVRLVNHAAPLPEGGIAAYTTSSPNDRVTSMAYDAANRMVMQVDALGAVTRQVHDADGRVVNRTAYANPISIDLTLGTPGTAEAIRQAVVASPGADRTTRYGYDQAGRLRIEIDALGAATQTEYDGAGRAVSITRHATPVDTASLGAVSSLGAMQALVRVDEADRTSRKAYDAAGRLVYEVDPLGAVAYSQFDGAGRLTRSTRYAKAIPPASATTAAAIALAIVPDFADRSDTYTYNAAGQRMTATNALGYQESWTYDALGHQLTFTNVKGATWTYAYDVAGRRVTETAPQVALTSGKEDGSGNATPVIEPNAAGIVTRLAYDALGNLVQRTEAVGRWEERTTRYEYDAAGRQVRVVYPSVRAYELVLDPATGVPTGNIFVREEPAVQTQTYYDALGNAVASSDVGGAISQKAYDQLGRVAYEVDALGYVSGYRRNAFGDVLALTRHATPLFVGAFTQAATTEQIRAALTASAADRTLAMTYDRAGRVSETTEGAVYVYDASADADKQTGLAGRTTRNSYDAFGQLVQTSALRNKVTQAWATTTHHFDAAGREIATVDALGYLTRRSYDARGNLTESREYTTAVAEGWTPKSALPANGLDDRVTTYAYDRLDRRTTETRVGVEFSTASDGTSTRGNASTTFGYDALGNQTSVTDANGHTTFTYYDALGRVAAVAAPQRMIGDVAVTPLTVFERDAHGNVARKIEHALGAVVANAATFTAPATHVADRVTQTAYDALGRAMLTTDAEGATTFSAYDAHGNVTKKWQPVARYTSAGTVFELNTYDKLGRLVETRTPASNAVYQASGEIAIVSQQQAGMVKASTEYNGFGEVTRKGSQGVWQEFFEYDNAGRLWRTNGGDGNVRINLFDLQGNVTAELRSAGSGYVDADLRAFDSAQAADLSPFLRRTDTRYDLLGRVTARTEAARAEHQGGVVARRQNVAWQVMESAYVAYVNDAGDPVAAGQNSVSLAWSSLASFGSGDIKVSVKYRTPLVTVPSTEGGPATTRGGTERTYNSPILNGDASASWTRLTWTDADVQPFDHFLDIGIASVTRVTVYKKDVDGVWRTVIDQPPGYGPSEILVEAPPDPSTAVRLQLRTAGSAGDTGWWDAPLVEFGKAYRFDAAGLGVGNYEYRATVTPLNEAGRVVATGTLSTVPPTSQAIGRNGDDRWLRPTVQQKTDRWGNVVEMSDPRKADWKTIYRYNAANQLVQQTQPDAGGYTSTASPVSFIYYDKVGRQLATRDANGNVSGRVYDAGGNLVKEIDGEGKFVEHRYTRFGDRVGTTDAMGNGSTFEYDKLGRLVRLRKPTISIYRMDGSTELRYVESTEYREDWTYDQLGRKLTHTNGNREMVSHAYDLRGNLVETKQPMGQVTRFAYDAQDRKVAERDPNPNDGTAQGSKTSTWSYDYFSQLLGHWDLGGTIHTYTYDNARQLVKEASGRGKSITYGYDAAGQLTTVRDTPNDKTTTYVYDLGGRKVRERVVQRSITYQDNNLAYDALGRLRDVADARVHMIFDYDKVGNRTRIASSVNFQGTSGEITAPANRHFVYDKANRQVIVDGITPTDLGTQGHRITYDANGNRTSDEYWGSMVVASTTEPGGWQKTTGFTKEVYEYDVLNRLLKVTKDGMVIDARFYDGAGRVTRSGPGGDLPVKYSELINEGLAPGQMNGKEIRVNGYDANGRMVHQVIKRSDNTGAMHVSWNREQPMWTGYVPGGYDAAGNVLGYVVKTEDGKFTQYTTTLAKFEGYAPLQTTGVSAGLQTGTIDQGYDVNGHLAWVVDAAQAKNNREFVNDSAGRALYVKQDGNIQRQLIVNGEVLGIYGVGVDPLKPPSLPGANPNFANIVDFDFGYSRITANYPNASPGAYQVRAGDTLQSIAQSAFGDSSLWYRIAEANGLTSDRDLRVGHALNIPNRAATISNNSTTFKPYDPSRIQGDMTPTMPMPQDEKGGCGGVGQLLMVIVAIAVSAFIGPGLLAAAASSIASQAVGVMTGTIDRFSWKGVALSMISAGVTSGVSAALSEAISGGMQGATVGTAGAASQVAASSWLSGTPGTILRAGLSNVITQGIGVATGLQRRFDWRGVAASAVGAGVGAAVGDALGVAPEGAKRPNFGDQFGKRLITGLAAGTAAAVLRGGKVAIQQVAVDAFGNALGQSIAEAMNPQPSPYSLATGDSGIGLRPAGNSGTGLNYGGYRASTASDGGGQYGQARLTPDMDESTVRALREELELRNPVSDEGWVLAVGPGQYGRSLGGYGPASPTLRVPMTREEFRREEIRQMNAAGTDNSSSLLGATAGVAASLGNMALGGARLGSNLLLQGGDILALGLNHDHPLMQQVWSEQRAVGAVIVNVISNPVAAATGVIEGIVNRYDTALAQPTNFDRSYELGKLFNDVGQTTLGLAVTIRGTARAGAAALGDDAIRVTGSYGGRYRDTLSGSVAELYESLNARRGEFMQPNVVRGTNPNVSYSEELFTTGRPREITLIATGEKVAFDRAGFPILDPYLYQGASANVVRIRMTGDLADDFRAADAAAGLSQKPEGYVWHHHQDLGVLQLVRQDVHRAVRHSGGVSFYNTLVDAGVIHGTKYPR